MAVPRRSFSETGLVSPPLDDLQDYARRRRLALGDYGLSSRKPPARFGPLLRFQVVGHLVPDDGPEVGGVLRLKQVGEFVDEGVLLHAPRLRGIGACGGAWRGPRGAGNEREVRKNAERPTPAAGLPYG